MFCWKDFPGHAVWRLFSLLLSFHERWLGRLRLAIRKSLLTRWVLRYWTRLTTGLLEVFRTGVSNATLDPTWGWWGWTGWLQMSSQPAFHLRLKIVCAVTHFSDLYLPPQSQAVTFLVSDVIAFQRLWILPDGLQTEVSLALGRTPEILEGWGGERGIHTFPLTDIYTVAYQSDNVKMPHRTIKIYIPHQHDAKQALSSI